MDFGTLLQTAHQNSSSRNGANYYKTKFEPPKKEAKTKTLSTNIKKFLAKKEEEEKKRSDEAKRKREELLAMRDPKAKNKIKKMLKVIKSANKSVLEEAVDNNNTAVTMQGPDQPDEDDYGYVSQEASAFYSKMMEKYKNIPEEEKFSSKKRNSNSDLSSTKDRVRAAILRQQEEELLPHKRKRKSYNSEDIPNKVHAENYNDDIEKKEEKPKSKRPIPPPLDFNELLKIAEKKQFEPVIVEPKKRETTEEQERLMTKKQKKEYEEQKAYQEARLKRDRERTATLLGKSETLKNKSESSTKQGNSLNPKIPKINDKSNTKIIDKRNNFMEQSHVSNNRQENTQMMNNKNLQMKKINDEKYKSSSSNSKIAPNKIDKESRESFDCIQKGSRQTSFSNTQLKKNGIYHSPFVKEGSQSSDSSKKKIEKKGTIENQNSKLNYVKNDKELKSSPNVNKNVNFNTKLTAQCNNSKSYKNEVKERDEKKQIFMKSVGNQVQKTKPFLSSEVRQNKEVVSNRINQSKESCKGEVFRHSDMKQDKASDLQRNRQLSFNIPSKTKQTLPNDLQKTRQFSSSDMQKARQFPPNDVKKIRQFPPSDIQKNKKIPSSDVKKHQFSMSREGDLKKQKLKKRRILDDDSEYDSSLEDFIDDGPEEGGDVSQYIKEIFGYDKSRYRDNEDDDNNMESNYSQVMKEEYISKKIGLMEDLEDMRQEALEKKRKIVTKKRKCD